MQREGIRRSTRLTIHVKELGMGSRLHAVAVDADGQVALQRNALGTGIVGCSFQLEVEMVLDVVDKGFFRNLRGLRELRVLGVLRIRLKPPLILGIPRLEVGTAKNGRATLLKEF